MTLATVAKAEEKAEEKEVEAVQAPCGVLESFLGDVQILNSTRTRLVDATNRAAIPCGSWVSVNHGWAQIRHQNGPHIHVGGETFVQLPDFKNDPNFKGDHLVLYKGQVFAEAGDGEEEFRMVSSMGRVRVKRGKIIFLFNRNTDETQLISVESSATLENRFETSRKVRVQAGESTELNFKLLRVIPTLPSAISIASLRPKLADLRIAESDRYEALQWVLKRQGRKFAAPLVDENSDVDEGGRSPEKKSGPHVASRKLASTHPESYLRHPPEKSDALLHAHWVKKMVGGESIGERILYPDKYYGRAPRAGVEIIDPGIKLNQKQKKQEDVEKKHLIEQLTQIRMD
jgi:hypothetical protein